MGSQPLQTYPKIITMYGMGFNFKYILTRVHCPSKNNIIFTIDKIRAIRNTMAVVSLFLFIVPISKNLTTKNVFLP